MKKKIAFLNPTSYDDLIEKIKIVWVWHINPQYCEDLADSMPQRIAAVIAAKGYHTEY